MEIHETILTSLSCSCSWRHLTRYSLSCLEIRGCVFGESCIIINQIIDQKAAIPPVRELFQNACVY